MSASLPLTPPLIAVFGRSKPFIFGELRNGTAEPRRSAAFFLQMAAPAAPTGKDQPRARYAQRRLLVLRAGATSLNFGDGHEPTIRTSF